VFPKHFWTLAFGTDTIESPGFVAWLVRQPYSMARCSDWVRTGRVPRWYVLPRMIWQPSSSSWSVVRPFMVPWVPTGMKTGMSTTWWGRTMRPTRALVVLHRATISYCSGPAAAVVAGAPDLTAAVMAAMDRRGRLRLLVRLSVLVGYPKRRRMPSIEVVCNTFRVPSGRDTSIKWVGTHLMT